MRISEASAAPQGESTAHLTAHGTRGARSPLGACRTLARRLQMDRSGPFFTAFWAHSSAMGTAKSAKTVHAGVDFRFRRPKPDRLLEPDLQRKVSPSLSPPAGQRADDLAEIDVGGSD